MVDHKVPLDADPYPDNDRDESEVDTLQKAEKALYASMARQAKARMEHDRGPPAAYTISPDLYDKALKQNDQLTESERDLLMSRGDLVGKALARPQTLTLQERYELLGWPAPEVVEANIKQATGNALRTPRDLFAKARALWESGRLSDLSDGEFELFGQDFRIDDASVFDTSRGNQLAKMSVPGHSQATELVLSLEGIHQPFYELVKAQWLLDPNIDGRRRARQAQRAAAQSPGSFQFQRSPRDPAIEYIIDEMMNLQNRWSQGNLTNEEYKVNNTTQLHALRLLAGAPTLQQTFPAMLPGLPNMSSTGNLPAPFTSGFPQIIPSSAGNHSTSATMGGLGMLTGQGVPPSYRSPSNQTPLESQFSTFQSGSFDPYPTSGAFSHPQTNMVSGSGRAGPRLPPQDPRLERGAGGRLAWPPTGAPPVPRAILGRELEEKGKAEGLSELEFQEYVRDRWDELTDEERAAYEVKHEAARLKAWDEYNKVKLADPMEEARRLSRLKRKALLDEQIRIANSQGKKY